VLDAITPLKRKEDKGAPRAANPKPRAANAKPRVSGGRAPARNLKRAPVGASGAD